MKKSKQAKASEPEHGVDMISNLPDPILHLILSGIPTTEEVIRTSILSTRWRYLWTSVPSVDIDYLRGMAPPNKCNRKKFEDFVYSVLLKKCLDLDSLCLCFPNRRSMSKVSRWMDAAFRRNVKVIDLTFRPREQSKDTEVPHRWILKDKFDDIKFPLSLVTCGSLEVLRLFLFRRGLSLPNFRGFPALRVLELNSIGFAFEDEKVEAFFKSLPLLEELSLISCLTHELEFLCISCPNLKNLIIDNREMVRFTFLQVMCPYVRICCPKLVFLELVGSIALNFFFESLNSLKKVVFHAEDINPEGLSLSAISHVESLSLSLYVVLRCLREKGVPPSLPNLKTLELTVDDYAQKAFPQWMDYFREDWHRDEAVKILARKLRKVEFVEFDGWDSQLRTASFLLEYGNTLEEMVFIWENKARYHKESKKTMKVSDFHKASSTVKLISLLKLRVC